MPLKEFPLPAASPKDLQVAILGAGLMGHSLAALFAAAGSNVYLWERDAALRESAASRILATLGQMQRDDACLADVRIVGSMSEMPSTIHFLTEAVAEVIEIKHPVFAEAEKLFPNAVLASNTSVIRISEIAVALRSPARMIGTHWWNPPTLMPIVEVVPGEQTSSVIADWTEQLILALGKIPVRLHKDTPGFIGNRLQHALWREAFALVEEGIAEPAQVDLVARNTLGLKLSALGPLENADYVGLDLTRAIHDYVFPTLSHATSTLPLVVKSIEKNNLGAKTGRGLFQWPQGRREQVTKALTASLRRNSDTAQTGDVDVPPSSGGTL